MRYISTRGQAPVLPFAEAMLTGLARDGGLYVPEAIPQMDAGAIAALAGLVLDGGDIERAVRVAVSPQAVVAGSPATPAAPAPPRLPRSPSPTRSSAWRPSCWSNSPSTGGS